MGEKFGNWHCSTEPKTDPSLRSLTLNRSIAFEAVQVSSCWSSLNVEPDGNVLAVTLGTGLLLHS
jgi:hypothetical protein